MNIQRQYSLPNCTLVLEGFGDANGSGTDPRPLLSKLVNAECHFVGHQEPLSGGREFLDSLVNSVNLYAQELFSGVHSAMANRQKGVVDLQQVDAVTHRLTVHSEAGAAQGNSPVTQIDLSTVQLFDLVEAIDQLFADSQTLPDLTPKLVPVPRRYVRSQEPIAQRAIPAVLGVSSLAATAAALFVFAPVPRIEQPEGITPRAASTTATPSPGASPSPTGSPGASPAPKASPSPTVTASPALSGGETDGAIDQAPAITDSAQLAALQESLSNKLQQAWQTPANLNQDLVYRVSVGGDGSIVGYKPVNPSAVEYESQTPLPTLLFKQIEGTPRTQEPLAQFKVTLLPGSKVEVAPWAAVAGTTGAEEITQAAVIRDLQPRVYDQINNAWKTEPTFKEDLIYRIRVTEDGTIVDYLPSNDPARNFVQETPLSTLAKEATDAPPTQSLALYKAVFKPNGVLQVSPWRGLPE